MRIVSGSGLLQIKLLQTFPYRLLCEAQFSRLWDECPRAHLLYDMVYTDLIWEGAATLFSGAALPVLHSYEQCVSNPAVPLPFQHLVLSLTYLNCSERGVVVPHRGLSLHSLNGQ